MRTAVASAVLVVLSTLVLAGERDALEDARRFTKEGKDEAAFAAYLRIHGAEHLAIGIARREPGKYLSLLAEAGTDVPRWRVQLLSGDLLLLAGRKDEALACYRSSADELAGTGIYPVEPPARGPGREFRQRPYSQSWQGPVTTFEAGPGSHRDNWLIRRFLALSAFEDAGREFSRIHELHRPAEGAPYTARALRFAVDHAFFHLMRERPQEALDVLLDPFLVLDMDRMPRQPFPSFSGTRFLSLGRKSYVRLAYGIFKAAGGEETLVRRLEGQAERGTHMALRVLAEVRRNQGRLDDARELELRYVEEAGIPEPGRSYRRGLIFEEAALREQAAAEYERIFALPWAPPNLPQGAPIGSGLSQQDLVVEEGDYEGIVKSRVLEKLQRLYGSLGRTEEMLGAVLRRFEARPALLEDERMVATAVARCRRAGFEPRLLAWAEGFREHIPRPAWRANLLFALDDHEGAANATAGAAAESERDRADLLQHWREKFRAAGEGVLRTLLETLVKSDPADARSRILLLEIDGDVRGERAIEVMEAILTGEARYDYRRRRGKGVRVDFGSPFELAYRLMRLYERHGRAGDLRALGLRIARRESPFEVSPSGLEHDRGENGVRELGEASLALAVLHAEEAHLPPLEEALRDSPWIGALAQVVRRRAGADRQPEQRTDKGWANLPEGVRLLASNESVLALARDEKYLYSGHPWGVAVYDHRGRPVTRVALNDCARALAAGEGVVWAGGTTGLFRITTDNWRVGHLWLDGNPKKRDPDDLHRKNRVSVLALDGLDLWIGVRGAVLVLDTVRLHLRTWSKEEARIDDRIVLEKDHVWTGDGEKVYRYDRATDTWAQVTHRYRVRGNRQDLELIGDVDGRLLGSVDLGQPFGHRLCVIDREKLTVEPMRFDASPGDPPRRISDSLEFLGRHDGRPVFGRHSWRFTFDAGTMRLRPLAMDGEGPATTLGLAPAELHAERVSSLRGADLLHSDSVLCLHRETGGDRIWLGTRHGVAVLDRAFRVVESLTRRDGLLCDLVTSAAEVGGKLYFGSARGDRGGGLIVFHPEKRVFTARLRQDGLGSDKISSISVEDGKLLLVHGGEYLRGGNGGYRFAAPSLYDPKAGEAVATGPDRILSRREAGKITRPEKRGPMGFLGGEIISEHRIDGMRVVCGTRGLEVTPEGSESKPAIGEITAEAVPSYREGLVADAAARKPRITTREQLAEALRDENPYYRAAALTSAAFRKDVQAVDLAASALDDPVLRVRSSALYLLARSEDAAAVRPYLKKMLADPDAQLRGMATVALCRGGTPPDAAFLREVLESGHGYGNYPTGAKSSAGVEVSLDHLYRAVAPHATAAVFAVLLEHPLRADDYEPRVKVFTSLGEALRKRPGAVGVLLRAEGRERMEFARAVIGHAGRSLLPPLLDALETEDRVQCANAALGCGAVGDAGAIPALLAALDLESGLSRAAIVRALGDLKAREALPRLTELYKVARRDPGGGYRMGQAMAVLGSHYEDFASLGDLASEWDELEAAALRPPVSRGSREKLLTPEIVLDAVRRIGPGASQEFYRRLAADRDSDARREAAVGLASGGPGESEVNLRVLRSLLADADISVASNAAVSLLLLGEESARSPITEWLASKVEWERNRTLSALMRVEKRETLAFALERIREIAEGEVSERFGSRYLSETARKLLRKLDEAD